MASSRVLNDIVQQLILYYDYIIELMNDKYYVLQDLKAQNFDMIFLDCEPLESKIAEEIGVPFMQ